MKEFAPFRLDTVNQCLWRLGEGGREERILLTPKAFGVLKYLVENAGRLVSHEELLEAVWPGTVVEPQAVKKHILEVRCALVRGVELVSQPGGVCITLLRACQV